MSPTSSMCAATSTRSFDEPLPFFVAMRFPMPSILQASTLPRISSSMMERISSSRLDTPFASESLCSSVLQFPSAGLGLDGRGVARASRGQRVRVKLRKGESRRQMNSVSSRAVRSMSRRQTVSTGECIERTGMLRRPQGTPEWLTWMAHASVPLGPGRGSTW